MEQRTVDLSAIEILTLDEADRMLDMGFLPPLRRVLAALPRTRQTLLFSATISKEVVTAVGATSRASRRASTSRTAGRGADGDAPHPSGADGRKGDLLTHVLTQAPVGQALVFCKTKRGSNRVGEHLERAGMKAAVIHGNKSQGARNRALGDFKAGRVTVLVATDIAARGLDIVQLPLVVNYDLPLVADDYIHRVGRTGRAGHGRTRRLAGHRRRSRLLHDIQRLLAGAARTGGRRRASKSRTSRMRRGRCMPADGRSLAVRRAASTQVRAAGRGRRSADPAAQAGGRCRAARGAPARARNRLPPRQGGFLQGAARPPSPTPSPQSPTWGSSSGFRPAAS